MVSDHLRRFEGFKLPGDPRSGAEWDAIWRWTLDHAPEFAAGPVGPQLPKGPLPSPSPYPRGYGLIRQGWHDEQYWRVTALMRTEEVRTVLYPGLGLCALPRFLAHQGFHVTAVDHSRVALEYSRRHDLSDFSWLVWVDSSPKLMRQRARRPKNRAELDAAREASAALGGRIAYRLEDLFEADYGEGAFDVIVVRCLLEHYQPAERQELCRRFKRWLKPDGFLVGESEFTEASQRREPASYAMDTELAGEGFQPVRIDEVVPGDQWAAFRGLGDPTPFDAGHYVLNPSGAPTIDVLSPQWPRRRAGHPFAVIM